MPKMTDLNIDFALLLKDLTVPVMVLDSDLKFVFANDNYCKAVQRKPMQLLGEYIFTAFPDAPERVEEVKAKFLAVLDGQTTYLNEQPFLLETKDGVWTERVWKTVQQPYRDKDGKVTHMVQYAEDVTDQIVIRNQRDAVSAELDHRVKNMLTVIEAMAMLGADTATSVEEYVESFSDRLAAISRNFTQLSESKWTGLSIRKLLVSELSQLVQLPQPSIKLQGPDIVLTLKATKDASMLIHELATNAAKHGFLSQPLGQLDVSWYSTNTDLVVHWKESGVGGVREPEKKGFGSKLITLFPNISVDRTFNEDGIDFILKVPLEIAVAKQF